MTYFTATLFLSLLSPSFARTITWSSVAFVFHGEKIPDLHDSPYNLTPLGANQLLAAGSVLRDRYLDFPSNGSIITTGAPIDGMSVNAIENSQLYVLALDEEYVTGSALAFMEGLYPPRSSTVVVDEESENADGSNEEFPLNGYQYPNVHTVSSLDFNYLYVAGNLDCNAWSLAQTETLLSPYYQEGIAGTSSFYSSLNSTVFSDLPTDILNYGNAYELYEYALYEYNHNNTIYNSPDFTLQDLGQLHNLASSQLWQFTAGENITSIAGQTLAAKVLSQFYQNIQSSGVSDKMTLMFGSFEPMLSFFALSSLSVGPAASRFNFLPLHGSTMAFELFSSTNAALNPNITDPYPSIDELYVRFLFRNGTDDTEHLISYPLFGNPNSELNMAWTDFVQGMASFTLSDIVDWCNGCQTVNLFCTALEANTNATDSTATSGSKHNRETLSPAVAGVVGAFATLASLIVIGAILFLAGFRINHEKRGEKAGGHEDFEAVKRSGSGNGGFKGAHKLGSDTDLALKRGAGASIVRQERVGSWELNDHSVSPLSTKHNSLDKEIESGRVVSTANYDRRHSEDGVNPFGDPVQPKDHV